MKWSCVNILPVQEKGGMLGVIYCIAKIPQLIISRMLLCRWDPPVYPSTNAASGLAKGSKPRIESAFAHGSCPPKLVGWDAVRASNLAELQQPDPQAHRNAQSKLSTCCVWCLEIANVLAKAKAYTTIL